MPVNYTTVNPLVAGVAVFPANSLRVALRIQGFSNLDNLALIGNDIATGIVVPIKENCLDLWLVNIVGSAIREPVSILVGDGLSMGLFTEIYRTPDGIT